MFREIIFWALIGQKKSGTTIGQLFTTGQKQTYLFSHLLPIYVFFIIVSTDDVMMSHNMHDAYLWRHFHSKFYSIYFERETFDKTIL